MSIPLVSIIIPCYNAEKYVTEAIQSALDQTYPNCEIIVIDDGSTDGSLEAIKSFGHKIRWKSGLNRGGCAARNRALGLAEGEWFQFLDADDWIRPEKIETQLRLLHRDAQDTLLSCGWTGFTALEGCRPYTVGSFWKDYSRASDLIVDAWNAWGSLVAHTWLVPRKLADQVGGWNESLIADQDGEYFGRLLIEAKDIRFANDILCGYRVPTQGNVSKDPGRAAFISRLDATHNVAEALISRRADSEALIAIRNRWLSLALTFHEVDRDLKLTAIGNAKRANNSMKNPPPCGTLFPLLSRIIGMERAFYVLEKKRTAFG